MSAGAEKASGVEGIFKYRFLKQAFISAGDIISSDGTIFIEVEADNFESEACYIKLRCKVDDKEEREELQKKIHISILTKAEEGGPTERYIEMAWDAIMPILIKYKMICSKVYVAIEAKLLEERLQKGKAIVLYMRNERDIDKEKYWCNLLYEIEDKLLMIESSARHKISGDVPVLRYKNEPPREAEATRGSEKPRLENAIGDSRFFFYSQELPKGSEVPEVDLMLRKFVSRARGETARTAALFGTEHAASGGASVSAADKIT
jgi:hypothetical protein